MPRKTLTTSLLCLLYAWSIAQNSTLNSLGMDQASHPATICYDLETNSTCQTAHLPAASPTAAGSTIGSIDCMPNKFWASDPSYGIAEYSLAGNTATFLSYAVTGPSLNQLAYCQNLDSLLPSHTFYNAVGNSPSYYDGSAWHVSNQTYSMLLLNCGGQDSHLYYQTYTPGVLTFNIVRYDGQSFTDIYQTAPNYQFAVADLAVDIDHNVWFAIGLQTSQFSDSLLCISPTGQVLQRYAFQMNTYNAYGSFIQDSTLYIGLGGSNPVNPNALLPVNIQGNTTVVGTSIPMPVGNLLDLASCNPGKLLKVDPKRETGKIHVFPNPTTEEFRLDPMPADLVGLSVVNSSGQVLRHYPKDVLQANAFSLSGLEAGLYLIRVSTGEGEVYLKCVKGSGH